MFVSIALAIAALVSQCSAARAPPAVQSGFHTQNPGCHGFGISCSSWYLDKNATLRVKTCGDNKTGYTNPSIELGRCVGNENGRLVTPGSGFQKTCHNISLTGGTDVADDRKYTLTAYCDGNVHRSSTLNLNDFVCNINGTLRCE